MASTPSAFVAGATGTQGGAVARHLRGLGWQVHTISRDPSSAASKALASAGVQVTAGNWDDEAALRSAVAGCSKVFINLYPTLDDRSREGAQARRIIELAHAAGSLDHVVYASTFKDQAPDAPDFVRLTKASKHAIEGDVRVLSEGFGVAWTVIRPGWLMANLLRPKVAMQHGGAEKTGVFKLAFRPDTLLPWTDEVDVAKFTAAAFQDPAKFNSKTITLASEVITVQEAIGALAEAVGGNKIHTKYLNDEEVEEEAKQHMLIGSQVACRRMADGVDMAEVRSWGIPLSSFAEYLQRERDEVVATYVNVPA
ncbi:hypothetical protein BX600DRAFT_119285 [Xylariales sp. PMI_506]|nr:hypothetical protein BX600DRAFT_119285 [Xylariales sp. PMI_506]